MGEANVTRKILRRVVLGACVAMSAVPASAAITWDFTSGLTQGAVNAGTYGNTRYETDGGVKVTASAWSNTVGSANTAIDSAYLGFYSGNGLGVTNRDGSSSCPGGSDNCEGTPSVTIAPEHAVDNNDRYDAVLLHFDSAVNLLQVAIGYKDTDADISVLASNGAALSGRTYDGATGLVNAGWDIIGNYANLDTGLANARSIPNTKFATDWLILAYNPAFGSGTNLGEGNDYFKLSAVIGNTRPPGNAPEPGTALLLGAAVIGGLWRKRRAQRG
jgi:hypothetical protein